MAVSKRDMTIVIKLQDFVTKGIKKLLKGLKKLRKKGFKALDKSMYAFGKGLKNISRSLQTFQALAATVGVIALTKQFLDAGRTAENLRIRLSVLTGSLAEGNRMFKEMAQLASTVPQTFEEIMESATRLIGVVSGGVDEVRELMPLILDLSTATGIGVNEVNAQVIRMWSAGAAAADMFRERGVLAMLGFKAGATYSVGETREMLMSAWDSPVSKFKGASSSLADTWDGLMSMMRDAWFQFRVEVMDAGIFKFIKGALKALLNHIKRLRAEGTLSEWAQGVSDSVVLAIRTIIMFVGRVYDALVEVAASMMSFAMDIMQAFADWQNWWKDIEGSVTAAQKRLANTAQLKRLREELAKTKDDLAALNEAFKGGSVSVKDYEEKQKSLSKEVTSLATHLGTALSEQRILGKGAISVDVASALATQAKIDAVREHVKVLAGQSKGVEKATAFLLEFDKMQETFAANERKREEQRAAARAAAFGEGQRAEGFKFSEAETESRDAALGVIELKKAMLDLNQAYKMGNIDTHTYYSEKARLQEEQRGKEAAVLLSSLDAAEQVEQQRQADVQGKLFRLWQKHTQGLINLKSEEQKQNLASLLAQENDSREYLENRRKIALELAGIEIAAKAQELADINAQNAETEKLWKASSDASARLQREELDNALELNQAKFEGSELLEAQLLLNKQRRAEEAAALYAQDLEDFAQSLITKEELDRASHERRLNNEAKFQVDSEAAKAAKEEEEEKARKEEEKENARKLRNTQATAAGMAGAFKDMYEATGKESKEFFYAWKAMQIAETIISTYAAAQKAADSASSIPAVGHVMGPIAAAMAVAQGMARVAMIRAQTMAEGGKVPGVSPTPTADNIPALLTAGEYVQPVDVVKHYGVAAMEALRKKAIPRNTLYGFGAGGLAPQPTNYNRFARGGAVPKPPQPVEGESGGAVNITNVIDPQIMEQYVASRPGEKAIMNVISKNQFQMKQMQER